MGASLFQEYVPQSRKFFPSIIPISNTEEEY